MTRNVPVHFVVWMLFLTAVPMVAHSSGEAYRRWLAPKPFACTAASGGVIVTIAQQNTEFANLPTDAQFMINYIDNGTNTPFGPTIVEQTSGTKSYGSFAENFPTYPLTFDFRLDTLINGATVYKSSIIINCSGDTSGTANVVNLIPVTGSGGLTGTWRGKWICKGTDNGVPFMRQNKTSSLAVAQNDQDIAVTLDNEFQHLRGLGFIDPKKASRTKATLSECRTSGLADVQAFNHIVNATFSVKSKKASFTASGPYLSNDGTHRVIGSCSYSYIRTNSADPGVFGCVK